MKAIYVEIVSRNKARIMPYVSFGILTVAYGLAIYYFLPLALLSFAFGLILNVFFFILIGFLLGLLLFAVSPQRYLEVLLTYLFLVFETESMRKLVLNNLKVHSPRNKLTSMIFSMALAFIIFLLCMYQLIL